MIGYSEREIFTASAKLLLLKATRLVDRVPYAISGSPVRCHERARAVGECLGLSACDGHIGAVEHSWLWLAKHRGARQALDIYVPGALPQVQLVDTWSPLGARYRPASRPRDDIRAAVVAELVACMLPTAVAWPARAR